MIITCKSEVDTYKDSYEKQKIKNELNEILIGSLYKRIEALKKQNKAYKILLKEKLQKELCEELLEGDE